MRVHWEGNPEFNIAKLLKQASRLEVVKEPPPTAAQAQFDSQANLKVVKISCIPERMLFTVKEFVRAAWPTRESGIHQSRCNGPQSGIRQAQCDGRSRHGSQRDGKRPAKRKFRFYTS